MRRVKLEAELERRVFDYAVERGCILEKVKSASRRGWPDRELLCPGGVTIRLEFKRPGKTADPHQVYVMKTLRRLGHEVYVIDNFQTAKIIIDSTLLNL